MDITRQMIKYVRDGEELSLLEAIKNGGNPKVILPDKDKDAGGGTLLTLAATCGHHHLILPLIEAGVSVNDTANKSRTPLHEGAAVGNIEVVRKLLFAKADIEAVSQNDNGTRPLHLAVRAGHAAVVSLLLKEGADIEAPDKDGWGPLHDASYHGHAEIIKILVRAGANTEAEAYGGWTPLHRASLWGHKEAVQALLDLGADVEHAGVFKSRAVHYAASRGHIHILEVLLEHGADLNALDANKGNPVHSAAGGGRLATVVWLVEKKVQHDLKDKNSRTPEDMGQLYGYHHVAYWLLKQNASEDTREHTQVEISREEYERIGSITLKWAREGNLFFLTNNLPARPYRIHYQDENGWTPLHHAAFNNQVEAVRTLLEMGALRSSCTHAQETAADIAQSQGHSELYDILQISTSSSLSTKTRVERVQMYGHLLREISCAELHIHGSTNDNMDMQHRHSVVKNVSRLIDNGSPLQPVGGHTAVALHLAITSNCTDLLPLLLSSGAPLTTTTSGMSVLQLAWLCPDVTTHIAVMVTRIVIHKLKEEAKRIGSEELADEELKHGISTMLKTMEGSQPWHAEWPSNLRETKKLTALLVRASRWGIPLTASFIQKAGGSVTSLDVTGSSALHSALDNGHITTAKTLIQHMGANLFLQDAQGRLPFHLMPEEDRQHVLEESMSHDYRILVSLREKARSEEEKQTASCILILLAILYVQVDLKSRGIVRDDSWKEVFAYTVSFIKGENSKLKFHSDEISGNEWLICLLDDLKTNFSRESQHESEVDEIGQNREGISTMTDKDIQEDFEAEDEYFFSVIDVIKQRLMGTMDDKDNFELDADMKKLLLKAAYISCESCLPLLLHLLLTIGGIHPDTVLEPLCGATALHLTAWRGHLGLCEYLLSCQASNTTLDRALNTPAHLAYMFGHSVVGVRLLDGVQDWKNRAGRIPTELYINFKKYTSLYGLDKLIPIKVKEQNNSSALIKGHLEEFKKCWPDISLAVEKFHVDFTKGEAHQIQESIFRNLQKLLRKVGEIDQLFEGKVILLGSSADNLRLFAPDEYDCNVEFQNVSGFPGGGLNIEIVPVPPSDGYKGHKNCLKVSPTNREVEQLVKGSNFGETFAKYIMQALDNFDLSDDQLNFLPPTIRKTQVGVNISFSWEGTEFPLLFINVDLVPTLKAPWPKHEPRPTLTPENLDLVHVSQTGKNEWRYSFAVVENMILLSLSPDQHRVFLACKLMITNLKTESWAPRDSKEQYTYWVGHRFKIPAPAGFILKSAFMKEMEEIRNDSMWGKTFLLERMCSIFQRMCKVDIDPYSGKRKYYHAKMSPYFGGDIEKPTVGLSAPEILKFLESW